MHPSQILEDQVIHIKHGRFNQFGYEPAWNAYFDFYISAKYVDPPLLQLEDGMFHLFLRKNLNDQNPQWRMPSVRQMKRRLSIGQGKLEAMMERLDQAHLLKKVSGFRKGDDAANIPNHYILSDPIQTLGEFLAVAAVGVFGRPLKEEWHEVLTDETLYPNQVQGVPESDTAPVPELGTYKQTSLLKTEDGIWQNVLQFLQTQLPALTFMSFVADSRLLHVDKHTATIATPRVHAIQWMERQLSNQIRRLLTIEMGVKIESVTIVPLTDEEEISHQPP